MQAILNTATDIARQAGAIVRQAFGNVGRVEYKGAVNPVTETDKAAEAVILTRLHEAFPDHHILGEESGGEDWQPSTLTQSGGVWFVDPIDGTNNFAHGIPHVSVSLGLMVDGEMQVGVVYDPIRDDVYAAQRGGGAMWNGAPMHVSNTGALAAAFLATGFPYERRVAAFNNTHILDCFLRRSQGVRRIGSAALDLAYVASGRFDGYWEPGLSPWDLAAGMLLVEEAGGRVSDFTGDRKRLLSGEEVVASNGHIHDQMLKVLRDGPAAPHPDFPALR